MHTGLAVITGTEDRQHAYVALTRGTTVNMAYVFTTSPKLADPVPGPRPALELARYDRLTTAGHGGHTEHADAAEALNVLSGVLDRDGQQQSASQTRHHALANADHLAILNAIWTAETTQARDDRYQAMLTAHLPPGYRQYSSHQAKWLWRTLHAAELAGQDAGGLLAAAIAERDLAGACDIPSVLDARLRRRAGALVPLPAGSWAAQVPAIADPGRQAFVTEIAALMDARKARIGEHAADHAPPWATRTLGPVPEHPLDRLDWQQRAASIGAWRELSGYSDPADPIGPEPVAAAPQLRAAWHEALAASGSADRPDVRGMPDGTLLHLRDTYPLETAWAPPWVGDELRQVRAAAHDAHLTALRNTAEATAARHRGQHEQAARQQELAASYQALHDAYRDREAVFAAVMADRADWDAATRAQRHLAIAADTELRRRHPDQTYAPLRSAEPDAVTPAQRDDLTLTPREQPPEINPWIKDLAGQRRTFARRLASRQSLMLPAEDPDYGHLGQAFPLWPAPAREAILQPAKPEIAPSPRILDRVHDRDADMEAAD